MYQLFGPYWLLRRIGLGDLAEVFVATRTSPSDVEGDGEPGRAAAPLELVAVKRLSREMSTYAEVHALFAREGALAARFAHPKVVRASASGTVGGRPYIAMEYVPGADLAHLMERCAPQRLYRGPAVRIVLDVCDALEHVHGVRDDDGGALAVVHGDVTPSNILVSTSGVAKLIDFSVASSLAGGQRDTTVRGTYAYMSPEQARGQVTDRRTDVFAVGVVLWELLAGQRLFRRGANYLTLAAVVEAPVPALGSLDIGLSKEACAQLDGILGRALAKDAGARYGHVAELGAELEAVAVGLDWDLRPWTLKTMVCELLSEKHVRAGGGEAAAAKR